MELALEKYLGDIEVVEGYIRVVQSNALSSLAFFRSLRVIEGVNLFRTRWVTSTSRYPSP